MAEFALPRTRAALRAEAKRLREQLRLFAQAENAPPPPLGDTPPERMHTGYYLPKVIRWGQTPASKMTKTGPNKGSWYLIVPFAHTAPGYGTKAQQMTSRFYRGVAQHLQPGEYHKPTRIMRATYGRHMFLSFVTLTPRSRGWYIPPRQPPPVIDRSTAEAARLLLAAIKADLKARFQKG